MVRTPSHLLEKELDLDSSPASGDTHSPTRPRVLCSRQAGVYTLEPQEDNSGAFKQPQRRGRSPCRPRHGQGVLAPQGGCGSSQDCEPLDPPPSLTGPSAVGPAASVLHQLCPGLLGQTHLRGETPSPAYLLALSPGGSGGPARSSHHRGWGCHRPVTSQRKQHGLSGAQCGGQRGLSQGPTLTPQLPGGQKENYDSDLDGGSPIRLSGRRLHGPAV